MLFFKNRRWNRESIIFYQVTLSIGNKVDDKQKRGVTETYLLEMSKIMAKRSFLFCVLTLLKRVGHATMMSKIDF